MSIAKVIEVIAEGDTLEDAVANAVTESSKSVRNIRAVNLENIQARIKNGKVDGYRLNAKVTFVID